MQEAHDGLFKVPEVGEAFEGDTEDAEVNDGAQEGDVCVVVGGSLEHWQLEALLDVLDHARVAGEGCAEA